MKKYLLTFTIDHYGRYVKERLTSKIVVKVVLDEVKRKDEKEFIEVSNRMDELGSPSSIVILYVESYEVLKKTFNRYTDKVFKLNVYENNEGGYCMELTTRGEHVQLKIGFLELS